MARFGVNCRIDANRKGELHLGHKAGRDFFEHKQEWSKYKHLILDYYLKPYLAHVNRRNAPILLVDLFAGPGRYGDGSFGSPIILAEAASAYVKRSRGVTVLVVEKDKELAAQLRENMKSYGKLVDLRQSDCIDLLDEVAGRAKDSTTFLYVDPFSIGRLHLGKLGQVFKRVSQGASVELLFVFMANAFMRWAGACLRAEIDAGHVLEDTLVKEAGDKANMMMMAEALWDSESVRMAKTAITSKEELDAIAGGTYWREYLAPLVDLESQDRQAEFVGAYCKRLEQWFPVVIPFPIHASDALQIRKYWMIFATRYEPALDFINRAMATVRREQYEEWKADTLFAQFDLPVPVSERELDRQILASVPDSGSIQWKRLRWIVTKLEFGAFTDSQINTGIKRLLKAGKLKGPTGSKIEEIALVSK